MARIPDYDVAGTSVPRIQTPRFNDNSRQIRSEGVGALVGAVGSLVQQAAEHDDKLNYAAARASILKADTDTREALRNDPDPYSYEKRYRENLRKAKEGASSMIRGRQSRELFNADIDADIERGAIQVRGIAQDRIADDGRATLQSTIESSLRTALDSPDEGSAVASIQTANTAIGAARDIGYINAVAAQKLQSGFRQDYAEGRVKTTPLDKRIEMLNNPKGTVAEAIDADRRQALLEHAQTELQQQQNERKAQDSLLRQELTLQLADIRAASANGIPATDAPSRATLRQAFGTARGDAYFSQVQGAQKLATDVRRLNGMSNTELDQLVSDYKPDSQAGAAESAQLTSALKQRVSEIKQFRKSDPIEYLESTSSAVQRAQTAIQNNEPGSGQAYFNAVESEKERLGIATPFVFPKTVVPGSAEYQNVALLATNKYRQLPPEAAKFATNAVKSDDPKLVTQGALLLDAAENVAPSSYTSVPPPVRARAALVASMINAGAKPERAVQTAIDTEKVSDQVLATRNRAYGQFQKSNSGALKGFIDRDLDPSIFYSQPAATQALSNEFDRQTRDYFRQTNDIDLARALAWTDLRRVYGTSEVNGKREVVAFPPERFTVTPQEVRKELQDLIAHNPQADGSNAEDLKVVADSDTMRNVSAAMDGHRVRPSYRLVTKTGDLARDKNHVPLRYFIPDDEEIYSRYQKKQQELADEGRADVLDAKEYRAKKRVYNDALNRARDQDFGGQ